MNKLVVLGDIHGKTIWKEIIEKEKDATKIIFIGDYFDTCDDITPEQQMNNFRDISEFRSKSNIPVIRLIGNHDYHYFKNIGENGTSGYQYGAAPSIGYLLETEGKDLQMAYSHENFLFTHAGVSEQWLNSTHSTLPKEVKKSFDRLDTAEKIDDYINQLWKSRPLSFQFCGHWSPIGDEESQTPIWIRPRSLMSASQKLKHLGIIQFCGHTQQHQIDCEGKATGGKYWFIDTLGTSKQYIVIEDNIITCKSI